jgi:hypothetical protein
MPGRVVVSRRTIAVPCAAVLLGLLLPPVATASGARSSSVTTPACVPTRGVPLVTAAVDDVSFGFSVSMSADGLTALVGSPGQLVGPNPGAGEVAVYTRASTSVPWSLPTSLLPPPPTRQDGQGWGARSP